VGTIGVRKAVIAVVEKQDVAGLKVLDAAGDAGSGLGVPVIGGAGPHHDFRQAGLARGAMELRTKEAEWGADTAAVPPSGGKDGILTARQFVDDAGAAGEEQARMAMGVVADAVAGGSDLRRERRILFHVFTQHEEGRRYPMPLQERQ